MVRNKVVHLTSVHPAGDSRIFHKECKTLRTAGYEVVLIVPASCDEVVDGISIRSVAVPRSRRERMFQTVWQVLRVALQERADVYHFHDPELIPAGLVLRCLGKRVVYDVHEDLPRQIASKHWIPFAIRRPLAWVAELVEIAAAKLFSGVVGATPVIADRFTGNVVVVQNFPVLAELADVEPVIYNQRPVSAVYVGGLQKVRGLLEMVHAIAAVPSTLNARLVLAGQFFPAEAETEMLGMAGWEMVQYVGWQSRQGVANLLARARLGLVVLHPIPNYVVSYPVKMFEYMAAGIPIVASDFPLWRRIVEEAGCGLTVDPLDPVAIARAIQWLIENPDVAEEMGRRGREAVLAKYTWDVEAVKLISFYRNCLGYVKVNTK